MQILVVEDEVLLAKSLKEILEESEHGENWTSDSDADCKVGHLGQSGGT